MREIKELGENAKKVPPEKQQEYAETLALIAREESDPLIRRQAVLSIAHFPTQTSAETLQRAMSDSDREVRLAACFGWYTYGGDEAAPALIELLGKESDPDIRMEAIELLGKMKDKRAIPAFAAPLSENNPALQHFTVLALQEITGARETDPRFWLAYCRGEAELP